MTEIPFKVGDVVQAKDGTARGVVFHLAKAGERPPPGMPMPLVGGDLVIKLSEWGYRVTNRYENWEKVAPAAPSSRELSKKAGGGET